MRRALAALAVALLVALAVYWFAVRDKAVAPHVHGLEVAATIGSGEDAVAVGADGRIYRWLVVPDELALPELPLDEPPPGERLKGPVREQARVLGAVPALLRPYVARSYYTDSGIVVELDTGIELDFGDASQAGRKWRAAAAILADPEIEALDYVDLHSPARPSFYGESHLLPQVE